MLKEAPLLVGTRFEVAAVRLAETWLEAGRLQASPAEVQMVHEFLEQIGWRVRVLPGARVRISHRDGRVEELSREAAILLAYRSLTAKARYTRAAAVPTDRA